MCDWILEDGSNHTFLFRSIYHCHMNSINSKIFHNTTWNSLLKLEIRMHKFNKNIIEYMQKYTGFHVYDLELFSKIRSNMPLEDTCCTNA